MTASRSVFATAVPTFVLWRINSLQKREPRRELKIQQRCDQSAGFAIAGPSIPTFSMRMLGEMFVFSRNHTETVAKLKILMVGDCKPSIIRKNLLLFSTSIAEHAMGAE